jgi:hypothetical protein
MHTQFEVSISLRRNMSMQKNVLGQDIGECSCKPMTGWYRDGSCKTDEMDRGSHTVCCIVTPDFLEFALSKGNDLITPAPQFNFPGLKPVILGVFVLGLGSMLSIMAKHVRSTWKQLTSRLLR